MKTPPPPSSSGPTLAPTRPSGVSSRADAENRMPDPDDRWRLAVTGLDVGIWEYNFTTKVAFYSPRWKEMLGYGPEELTDRREEFFHRIHPDDRPGVESALTAYPISPRLSELCWRKTERGMGGRLAVSGIGQRAFDIPCRSTRFSRLRFSRPPTSDTSKGRSVCTRRLSLSRN